MSGTSKPSVGLVSVAEKPLSCFHSSPMWTLLRLRSAMHLIRGFQRVSLKKRLGGLDRCLLCFELGGCSMRSRVAFLYPSCRRVFCDSLGQRTAAAVEVSLTPYFEQPLVTLETGRIADLESRGSLSSWQQRVCALVRTRGDEGSSPSSPSRVSRGL